MYAFYFFPHCYSLTLNFPQISCVEGLFQSVVIAFREKAFTGWLTSRHLSFITRLIPWWIIVWGLLLSGGNCAMWGLFAWYGLLGRGFGELVSFAFSLFVVPHDSFPSVSISCLLVLSLEVPKWLNMYNGLKLWNY